MAAMGMTSWRPTRDFGPDVLSSVSVDIYAPLSTRDTDLGVTAHAWSAPPYTGDRKQPQNQTQSRLTLHFSQTWTTRQGRLPHGVETKSVRTQQSVHIKDGIFDVAQGILGVHGVTRQ